MSGGDWQKLGANQREARLNKMSGLFGLKIFFRIIQSFL